MKQITRINRLSDYLDYTASRIPDRIALVDENREISFSEMKQEAYKLAAAIAGKGYFKQPVGIFLPQSIETVPSMLGVAYSGNFFSVIDDEMPVNRIEAILDTFEPVAIITNRDYQEKVRAMKGSFDVVVYEDEMEKALATEDIALVDETKLKVVETDLLYVLFTSGSTGKPKGVAQPHRSVIVHNEGFSSTFKFDESVVFCNQAPFYYVMSSLEIFMCIKEGCKICIPPRIAFSFPAILIDFMMEHQVNTLNWVPTLLCYFANSGALEEEDLPEIRAILPGGEAMPVKQMNMWIERFPEAMVINLYGCTEMADNCVYNIIDREYSNTEALPMGKPLPHIKAMILGEDDKPVKEGEVGELCLRGPSISYGYYKDPEKTAAAFVQNPQAIGYEEKMYRTGDLVTVNEYGQLVYVTRKDFQIKHLGRRIELGDIETAASSLDGMDRNCCIYDDKNKRIAMFYSGSIQTEEILSGLKDLLPEYMIPSKLEKMRALPTNLNGKIDRVKLKKSLEEE